MHDAHHEHHHEAHDDGLKRMAASATLHCLIGCMIGELVGVTIGTHMSWQPHETVLLAGALSFISGYTVSTWPLMRAGVSFRKALRTVLAADTVSILTMVVVDNLLMLLIPGATDKDLMHPIYWLSRSLAVVAAYIAAYPVNLYLLRKGKGHALTHEFHHAHHE